MNNQNLLRYCMRTLPALLFFVVGLGMALLLLPLDAYAQAQTDPAIDAVNPSHRVSDSPLLRLPSDLQDVPPIVPPEPIEVEEMEGSIGPIQFKSYNIETEEVTIIPIEESIKENGEVVDKSEPFPGLLPPGVIPLNVFPPDDRTRVLDTTAFPWRTVGKLNITFPSGSQGWCSAAIIGCPDGYGGQFLTAGHCVYDIAEGGYATSLQFIPGLNEGYMPFNYALANDIIIPTPWADSEDPRFDFAFVDMDRNVGNFTGWMGRITAAPGDPIYSAGVNTMGYPCNVSSSRCLYPVTPVDTMWRTFDEGCGADEYFHGYMLDAQPGQSGSPVYLYNYFGEQNRYITSMINYGSLPCNFGVRINQTVFDDIANTLCTWNPPPTDYADLIDDGQAYSGFTPTAVTRGQTYFQVWNDVRNVGTASSGGFYVSYYASTDTSISTADHFIGSGYVSSVSPFNWADSSWSGTFPSSVPAGLYYVGWIIDSGGNVPEFDETNNTAYKDSYRLTVEDPITTTTTTACTPHAYYQCYDNDVYWYDSCGNREDKKEECGAAGCVNGQCNITTTTTIPPCIVDCDHDESGQLNIVETSGTSGSQVTVTVEVNSAPNMVDSLGFEVAYNPDCLEYTGFDRGDCVINWSFVDVTNPAPGILRIGAFTTVDPILQGESCDVIELAFNIVTPDLDQPEEAVRLDLQELVDDLTGWSTSPGYICEGGCDCDVSGDGVITPQDALCAFQKYLGLCPTACGSCEGICCDVNQDDNCTPADALCVFQEYLGIGCEYCN